MERASDARLRFGPHPPGMALDDAPHQRQPDPCTGGGVTASLKRWKGRKMRSAWAGSKPIPLSEIDTVQ